MSTVLFLLKLLPYYALLSRQGLWEKPHYSPIVESKSTIILNKMW